MCALTSSQIRTDVTFLFYNVMRYTAVVSSRSFVVYRAYAASIPTLSRIGLVQQLPKKPLGFFILAGTTLFLLYTGFSTLNQYNTCWCTYVYPDHHTDGNNTRRYPTVLRTIRVRPPILTFNNNTTVYRYARVILRLYCVYGAFYTSEV